MIDLDWNDIRIFLALFRGRSVRSAADELGMSHSTVSRHLTRLETSLELVLFTRSRDGLLPTDGAVALLEKAELVEATVSDLSRAIKGASQEIAGRIRVACPPLLSQILIMPIVAQFAELYPRVEIDLKSTNAFDDIARGTVDVVLRSQFDPNDNLVGRQLPEFVSYVYASPDYIDRHWFEAGETNATWIGRGAGMSADWVKATPFPNADVRHDISDMMDQAQAAVAGMGMIETPCLLGDKLSGLIRVPGTEASSRRPVWALTHPDLRGSTRVMTFLRFLIAEISKQRKDISGL